MTLPFVIVLCGAAVLAWPGRPSPHDSLRVLRHGGEASPAASRSASMPAVSADLVMELVACGLRAGLAVGDALAAAVPGARSDDLDLVVGRVRLGVPMDQAWARPPPEYDALARAMVLAELSGAPAAAVVSRAAADLRAERRERAELAAARLGVRLVLPLGLAVLPGFVLLAVVPIVLGLASAVLGAGS